MFRVLSSLAVLALFLSFNALPVTGQFSDPGHDQIDSLFSHYDRPGSPGCAVCVVRDGEVIFSAGYGYANLDNNIPITPQSRFMIASVSKQFSAAALLMLEQEGRLDLDEDIRPLIPGMEQFPEALTARQLIHHTSGLRDIYDLLLLADIGLDNRTDASEALDLITRQRSLNFPPGDEYLYSNSGYFLISLLVENRSGLSLRDYTDRYLFGPSGMESTHFHDDIGMIVPNRVTSYRQTSSGPGRFYRDNMDRVGARGLFTTVEDLARWDANFVGNRTPLERFGERMTEPARLNDGSGIDYATGLRLGRYKGLGTAGHGGSYMGFRTSYLRFPEEQIAFIVFCNLSTINPGGYAEKLADLYLKETFERRLAPYTGRFYSEALDSRIGVELRDGGLYLIRPDGSGEELRWEDDERLRGNSWRLRYRDGADVVEVSLPRAGPVTFRRN